MSAAGPMGMMVQKFNQGRFSFQVQSSNFVAESIQKAASTSLLLNGQQPGQYNSSLYDSRIKREIIQYVKSKAHPTGLGLLGASFQFLFYFISTQFLAHFIT